MLGEFQFEGFIIKNIDYKANPIEAGNEIPESNEINFAYTLTNDEDTYLLSILTHVINIQSNHFLDITVVTRGRFVFQKDSEIDIEEKNKIIKENGSAIMFPYIRSVIYNLTCADSCNDPVIMPTINFSKIIEDIDKRNQKSNKEVIE